LRFLGEKDRFSVKKSGDFPLLICYDFLTD